MSTALINYDASIHEMYVTQRLQVKQIAKHLKLPYRDVLQTIRNNNWVMEIQSDHTALVQQASHEFESHVALERLPTAERHRIAGARIINHIERKMAACDGGKDFMNARDLASAAKALKDASDVESRSVGLTENLFDGFGTSTDTPVNTRLISVNVSPKPIEPAPKHEILIANEVEVSPPILPPIVPPVAPVAEEEDPF